MMALQEGTGQPMYRIGEFSRLARTTVKTLRYYDEMGLLKPVEVDEWSGYRYYVTRQLYPLQRIMALRQAGLSVDEVRRVLIGQNVTNILNARKAELERDHAEVEERLTRLSCIIRQMEEDTTMQQQAIIKRIPSYTTYSREGVVNTYRDITPFIQGTHAECHAANPGLELAEPAYCFMSYLDGEYRETDIRLRFSQAVKAPGKDTPSVHFSKLPGVDAVCVYHRGAYDQLGDAYAFAYNWLEENGYRIADLARECYIDGMWNKPNVEDWLTEIQIPVQKG